MTYEKLKNIKSSNRTLKLLNSENFAFTLSFFYLAFIKNSRITLTHPEILSYLDDYIFNLNQIRDNAYPKEAKEYLDDFTNEKNGYLRKYHGAQDEAIYELTPYTQKALEFIESLEKNEFVGSRSKFNIIFELLEELEFEVNMSDDQRIEQLELEKREIDNKIDAIKNQRDIRFDSSMVKEHYMQIDEMVRKLKYDFSEIEYNFRSLNQTAMEKIALGSDSKGEVLGSIFHIEDEIRESDQGKSFFAFWQLLSDPNKSQKLTQLIENLYEIEVVDDFDKSKKLLNLKYQLLKSGEKVYGVSSKLIEQLRKYIDDRVWIENRRILELVQIIEKNAMSIKEELPLEKSFISMDNPKIKIDSIASKKLFVPKEEQEFEKELKEEDMQIDMESFYNLFFINEELLELNIQKKLLHQEQVSLGEVVKSFPVQKGVAELVGYISIAKKSSSTVIDEASSELLNIQDANGNNKKIKIPKIIFVRE